MKIPAIVDESYLLSDAFAEKMIHLANESAIIASAMEPIIASIDEVSEGASFTIPMLIPEETESGDRRIFEDESVTTRMLPMSLLWQVKTGDGHDGSVIVGRIDSIERIEGGLGNAKGVFDVGGVWGREALRLVRGQFLRGVSVDLDQFKGTSINEVEKVDEFSDATDANEEVIESKKIVVSNARVMAATLVPKPAFEECIIVLDKEPSMFDESDLDVADGLYEEEFDDLETQYAALAASAAPMIPPRDWFSNPHLSRPTPIEVDDDGRVYGHIATWKTSHIGLAKDTRPPRSSSKYAYFRTGVVRTDDGTDVPVGQITLAGGHASMQASAKDAVKHYDDTASAIVDVTAGEDAHGIWVAGALRPDATPLQVRALRASAPSGDWRPINGKLELVAVCQVNVPGFPTARAMVAGGQITALVAAGASDLAELRESKLSTLEKRLDAIEQAELAAQVAEEIAFMREANAENIKAMAASAAKIREEIFADTVNDLRSVFLD
jgi:hypothetical protein